MLLLRRGRGLEAATLTWNAVGIVVLAVTAPRAHSVALAGFGLDSLIEIGASVVVLWERSGTGEARQRRALRLMTGAFITLAGYLLIQTAIVFATFYPRSTAPSASSGPRSPQPSCSPWRPGGAGPAYNWATLC